MWWINLLIALVRYGPKIYKLLKEVYDLIKEALERDKKTIRVLNVADRKAELEKRTADALGYYSVYRDPVKLKELRDELKDECGK